MLQEGVEEVVMLATRLVNGGVNLAA